MTQHIQLPIDILSKALDGNTSCEMLSEDQSDCASVKLFDLCGHTGFVSGYSARGQNQMSCEFFAVIPLTAYHGETTPFKSGGVYAKQRIGATVKNRGRTFVIHQVINFTSTLPSPKARITVAEVREYMEKETGHGMWLTEAYVQRRADPVYRAYRHLVVMLLDDLAVLFWKGVTSEGEATEVCRGLVNLADLEGFDPDSDSCTPPLPDAPIINERGQLALF